MGACAEGASLPAKPHIFAAVSQEAASSRVRNRLGGPAREFGPIQGFEARYHAFERESAFHVHSGGATQSERERRTTNQVENDRSQGIGVIRRHEDAVEAGLDEFRYAADSCGHNRRPSRHRFEHTIGRRLGPRREHEISDERNNAATSRRSPRNRTLRASPPARTCSSTFGEAVHRRRTGTRLQAGRARRAAQPRAACRVPSGAEVGHSDDAPQRADRTRTHAEHGAVHAVAYRLDLPVGHTLPFQLPGCCSRVGHDNVCGAVREALPGQVSSGFVWRDQFATAADANRHPCDGCAREAKHVRIELARLDDAEIEATAPGRKGHQLTHRPDPGKTIDRERGDRRRTFLDQWRQRSASMEAANVHFELSWIEPSNQLDHLTFRSADVEAGQEDRDRDGAAW